MTTPTAHELDQAVAALREGGVVLYPTETVYGFGCDAADPRACERVRALKGWPPGRSLIVLVAGTEQAARLVRFTPEASTLAQAHWPGALTLILPSHSGGTLALRASPHPVPAALIAGLGRPITSSSANRTGDPPPRHLGDAGWFGPQGPDAAVDGGPTAGRVGSTIVDCCGPAPRLVRRGDLAPDELACAVEERADG